MTAASETRRRAARLKLKATAILAERGEPFEASVLFHEAVRLERALSREVSDPDRLLESAVERCWCLLDALDPFTARTEWVMAQKLATNVRDSGIYLRRLAPRYARESRAFDSALMGSPLLRSAVERRVLVPDGDPKRLAQLGEVLQLLMTWVGVPSLWWVAYSLEYAMKNLEHAWHSLRHAHALSPDDFVYEAMLFRLVPDVVDANNAREVLLQMSAGIAQAHVAVVLQYTLAELRLVQQGREPARTLAAVSAIVRERLRTGPPAGRFTRLLAATALALDAHLAGRDVGMEVLLQAGLDDLVPSEVQGPFPRGTAPSRDLVDHLVALAATETQIAERFDVLRFAP